MTLFQNRRGKRGSSKSRRVTETPDTAHLLQNRGSIRQAGVCAGISLETGSPAVKISANAPTSTIYSQVANVTERQRSVLTTQAAAATSI
jgi:hypothetical protein